MNDSPLGLGDVKRLVKEAHERIDLAVHLIETAPDVRDRDLLTGSSALTASRKLREANKAVGKAKDLLEALGR